MPAMLDDPDAATIYRVSGEPPYPEPGNPSLPPSIKPRHVMLRDRQTVATVVPFASRYQVPDSLLRYLNDQFNKEIEGGDTYPMMEGMPFDKFASYWFQNFGAIMLLGNIESADDVVEGKDWSKECLGTFYIKPNYPGRSSHVCNAGFIVTDASRNRGVGRLMGESYLDWAPRLGYTYSVFNLVYETNVASCKIWDALGFKRIGRVSKCGNLKSYPDRLIDAIMYGRELGLDSPGSDNDPDKEVIAHPTRQYEIARRYHEDELGHAGINKTTATIAERYHWSRIKETVSDVIRNCSECKELGRTATASPAVPTPLPAGGNPQVVVNQNQVRSSRSGVGSNDLAPSLYSSAKRKSHSPSAPGAGGEMVSAQTGGWSLSLPDSVSLPDFPTAADFPAIVSHHHYPDNASITPSHTLSSNIDTLNTSQHQHHQHPNSTSPMLQDQPLSHLRHQPQQQHTATSALAAIPGTTHSHSHNHHHDVSVYNPIDPQIISSHSHGHSHNHPSTSPHHSLHAHHDPLHDHDHDDLQYSFPGQHDHADDAHSFEALLVDAELGQGHDDHGDGHGGHAHHRILTHTDHGLEQQQRSREEEDADREREREREAVDRDLEMLIQQPADDDDEEEEEGDVGAGGRGGMDVDVDGVGKEAEDGMEDVLTGGMGERRMDGGGGKMDLGHLLSSHREERGFGEMTLGCSCGIEL
ncbi:hypothetical protein GE09DRAFT_1091811 [Coniochaeta sp. 2T2.1]|nr:hypothetical protein GE09DRAFT_1091811 [Coniochaeta sp. 2T2.1]